MTQHRTGPGEPPSGVQPSGRHQSGPSFIWLADQYGIHRADEPIGRQHVAAIGGRVTTLYKGQASLRQQLAMYHGYFLLAP